MCRKTDKQERDTSELEQVIEEKENEIKSFQPRMNQYEERIGELHLELKTKEKEKEQIYKEMDKMKEGEDKKEQAYQRL